MLEIRVDNRTEPSLLSPLTGIPFRRNYKYLGVEIDDSLNMKLDLSQKHKKEKNLNKMSWLIRTSKIEGIAAFHLFITLYRSKVAYATNLVAIADKRNREWFQDYTYRALKCTKYQRTAIKVPYILALSR